MSIAIITDSTCDIPISLIKKYGIIELPLTVHFGSEEFKDRVDITSEEFYKRLVTGTELPSTSQVNPGSFADIYKSELEKGNTIISIHISSELSGTYQSAVIAKHSLGDDDRISLIDSRTTTIALGMVVLKAAELSIQGVNQKDIVKEINEYVKKVRILIAVDTLKYLKKGGRLTGAQALIGDMLNIKPILTVEDGKVVVIEKVRGKKKVNKRMIELMKEKIGSRAGQIISVANARCPDTIEEIKKLIAVEFYNTEFIDTEVGSVIATHVGPGAYGVVFVEA